MLGGHRFDATPPPPSLRGSLCDNAAMDAVAAELEIRNVLAALALLADMGTVEEYVQLYTADAVWEMPANPNNGLPASRRVGRDEIAAGVHERRAAGAQGPGSRTRHVITNLHVMVDNAEQASAQAYFLYYSDVTAAPTLASIGHYSDTFRRTAEGWRLARRQIVIG